MMAIQGSKIPILSNVLDAGIIFRALAVAAKIFCSSSRIWRTKAHQQLVIKCVANVESQGCPRRALYITCAVAVLCTYINLSVKTFPTCGCSGLNANFLDSGLCSSPWVADSDYSRLLLRELDHCGFHLIPFPKSHRVSERLPFHGSLRLENDGVPNSTNLAHFRVPCTLHQLLPVGYQVSGKSHNPTTHLLRCCQR